MVALSGGHFTTDFAGGALPALVPFIHDRFHLNYLLSAVLILASSISSSVIQPLFGLWSDRHGALWLIPLGVGLAGLGIAGLASDAPGYWLVVGLVVVSGVGVAAFHPEGAKFAAYASGARRASGMSVFSVGGNVGFALGPAVTAPWSSGSDCGAGSCWLCRDWSWPGCSWPPPRRCCGSSPSGGRRARAPAQTTWGRWSS